jgi:hypothetical protein
MKTRLILLSLLLFIGSFSIAQNKADVNNDGILDATDYFLLKKSVIQNDISNVLDINEDGVANINDLLIIENYLYREGASSFVNNSNREIPELILSPGRIDLDSSYIDILLNTQVPIVAFEFTIHGVDSIIGVINGGEVRSESNVFVSGSRVLCTPGIQESVSYSKTNFLRLKYFSSKSIRKICISQPVFVGKGVGSIPVRVGDCSTQYSTIRGLESIKDEVAGIKTIHYDSDLNKDGYTDIVDVYQLEEFLINYGEKPGYDMEIKGKLKLSIERVDLDSNFIWINSSTSSALASFQLQLSGIDEINSIVGGAALENQLQLKFKQAKITAYLGKGEPILPDNSNLIKLSYLNSVADKVCIMSPSALSSIGNKMNLKIGECASLIKIIPGCTDSIALNYNALANKEDGSCTYPPKPEKPPKEKMQKLKEEKEKKVKQLKVDKERDEEFEEKEEQQEEIEHFTEEKEKINDKKLKIAKENSANDDSKKDKRLKKKEKTDVVIEESKLEEIGDKDQKEKIEEVFKALDLENVKSGYVIPEVSTDQRLRLENLTKGQMVFDKDIENFVIFVGNQWNVIKSSNQTSGKRVKKYLGVWRK